MKHIVLLIIFLIIPSTVKAEFRTIHKIQHGEDLTTYYSETSNFLNLIPSCLIEKVVYPKNWDIRSIQLVPNAESWNNSFFITAINKTDNSLMTGLYTLPCLPTELKLFNWEKDK